MKMRVEHDVCAAPGSPADGFRIAPTLMADRDTKCQRTGLENPPPGTRRIGTFLGGVDLNFVLKTGDRSVRIDDQGGGEQVLIVDALGAENNREGCLCGSRSNGKPGVGRSSCGGRP